MSTKLKFSSVKCQSRIRVIAEKWTRPMTVQEAASEIGMPVKGLVTYIKHLREAGSLVEVARNGGGRGGVTITYRHTGIYSPPQEDLPDRPTAHVARMPVRVFRDALTVALFGEAIPCAGK